VGYELQNIDDSCDAQSRALETVKFTTTTFAQLVIPIFVMILDSYGPYILHMILAMTGCIGIACILVSSEMRFPELLYFSFGLIGSLAVASNLIMMELALLFSDESSRRRVIALLSCLTDVGAGFGYWVLWSMANAGLSFQTVIILYFIVGFIVYMIATYLWRVITLSMRSQETMGLRDGPNRESMIRGITVDMESVNNSISHPFEQIHFYPTVGSPTMKGDSHHCHNNLPTINETSSLVSNLSDKMHRSTFLQQALSSPFIILAALYSFHDSRIAFVSTSSRDFLGSLGDDATGFRYLSLFSITAPLSLLGLPLVDLFIEKKGYIFAIQMVNVFALIHGSILIGTSSLNIQVVGFVVFAIYRCITYAILLNYLEVIAKEHILGKLTGLISIVPAMTNLMNIPISNWALGPLHGDFYWPNVLYTGSILLCVLGVMYLDRLQQNQMY